MERIEFSELTNRMHRNLVAVSAAIIVIVFFNIKIEKATTLGIEVSGLTTRVLLWILVAILLYHMVAFALRAYEEFRAWELKLTSRTATSWGGKIDDIELFNQLGGLAEIVEKHQSSVELSESGCFENAGLSRTHWKDAAAIRKIFKEAFKGAGLPYFNPHSFRHTLGAFGQKICRTPEDFKAWSQNMGHAQVLTTLTSYGAVAQHRQDEILAQLASAGHGHLEPVHRSAAVLVESDRLDRLEAMIAELGPAVERK